jgi:hypothetical protein
MENISEFEIGIIKKLISQKKWIINKAQNIIIYYKFSVPFKEQVVLLGELIVGFYIVII